jgi:hypothetical protein
MNLAKNNLSHRTPCAVLIFLITLLLTSFAPAPVSAKDLSQFTTQKAAQKHCPNDMVVWLNTNTGIWHNQGSHWYGRTKNGVYVCEKEAGAAGNRGSLNN